MESLIASSHHYYVMFLTIEDDPGIDEIAQLIGKRYKGKRLSNTIRQTRLSLDEPLGSLSLLVHNKQQASNNTIKYFYDIYIGNLKKKKSYFLCYPYSSLSKNILEILKGLHTKIYFYAGNVEKVVSFVKQNLIGQSETALYGPYTLSIVKYSAEVAEESNAKVVSLTGISPINSNIYDVLNSSASITLTPISLKMSCINTSDKREAIELAFDKLGNYRFWLKRNAQLDVLPLLNLVFSFLSELDAFDYATRLSSSTII